jgi:hypothetical protein
MNLLEADYLSGERTQQVEKEAALGRVSHALDIKHHNPK